DHDAAGGGRQGKARTRRAPGPSSAFSWPRKAARWYGRHAGAARLAWPRSRMERSGSTRRLAVIERRDAAVQEFRPHTRGSGRRTDDDRAARLAVRAGAAAALEELLPARYVPMIWYPTAPGSGSATVIGHEHTICFSFSRRANPGNLWARVLTK